MKRYIKTSKIESMAHILSPGVFWDIDGELLAFPYVEDEYTLGVAKSGDTYNHKKLWPEIKPKGCKEPYNYYPRGRVVIDNKGRPVIYMNSNVSESLIDNIKVEFGIRTEPKMVYDNSNHYKCHFDEGWKPKR